MLYTYLHTHTTTAAADDNIQNARVGDKTKKNVYNIGIPKFYISLSLKDSKNSLCKLGKTEFTIIFFLFLFCIGGGGGRRQPRR